MHRKKSWYAERIQTDDGTKEESESTGEDNQMPFLLRHLWQPGAAAIHEKAKHPKSKEKRERIDLQEMFTRQRKKAKLEPKSSGVKRGRSPEDLERRPTQ